MKLDHHSFYKEFKRDNGGIWWPDLDLLILKNINTSKKLEKKYEKAIYLKINKEIKSKKLDPATEMKALRLAKNPKLLNSKYIDLRFQELWEEELENNIIPQLNKMLIAFKQYYQKNLDLADEEKKKRYKKAVEDEKKRFWGN